MISEVKSNVGLQQAHSKLGKQENAYDKRHREIGESFGIVRAQSKQTFCRTCSII